MFGLASSGSLAGGIGRGLYSRPSGAEPGEGRLGPIKSKVADLLRALVPNDVSVAGGRVTEAQKPLFPQEKLAVARAVAKRRAEFGAGRTYARDALVALGCAPGPIPVGVARQPMWPEGFLGAITHTDKLCAVVVGRRAHFAGLGLDAEHETPLEPALIGTVCREEELSVPWGSGDLPKLLFVIKEAVFKAYFPATGAHLDFRDVAVSLDLQQTAFVAALTGSDKPWLAGRRAFTGRFGVVDAHLLAFVGIRRACGS